MRLVTFAVDGATTAGVMAQDNKVAALWCCGEALGRPASEAWASGSTIANLLAGGEEALAWARDIAAAVDDSAQEAVTGSDGARAVFDLEEVRLLCPVPDPNKFIGIGLNYRDHAEEQGARIPRAPIVFAKFSNSLIGPHDPIRYPRVTEQLDYEAELGVVIGRRGRDISPQDVYEHVAGYCVVNDVTARDVQLSDRQWVRGKTLDAMTPVGPYLTTRDEVADPHALRVRLWLNGELLQDSTTAQLIFDIPTLISHVSQDITLEPGDIIATGTPGGVGFAREPAVYMSPGDVVEVEVEGVGRLRNTIA